MVVVKDNQLGNATRQAAQVTCHSDILFNGRAGRRATCARVAGVTR